MAPPLAGPTTTTAVAADAAAAGNVPPPRPVRRRGHRAQSGVWSLLTTDLNPHHATASPCMHCQRVVPHHRKNEKARAHLKRCAEFRKKMAELRPEQRPAWLDLNAKVRGRNTQRTSQAASMLSATATISASSIAASLPLSPSPVGMDSSGFGAVVSDVEMLDEALIPPIQSTPTGGATTHEENSADDGHVGQVEPARSQAASTHEAIAENDPMAIGHRDSVHSGEGDASRGIESVQEAVAMHLYMTGAAIDSVADANFVAAFRLANSAVTLPTPEELRGALLERTYQRVRARVDADMLLSPYNAVSSNGWWAQESRIDMDRTSKPTSEIRYMAVNEAQTFFMGASHASETERRDPEFLANEVVRLMERSRQQVSGAVTDCTPAQQLTWQKLKRVYPSKFFHGCVSHTLRLYIQDIFAPATAGGAVSTTTESTSSDLMGTAIGNDAVAHADAGVSSPSPFLPLRELTATCRLIVDCFTRERALRTQLQQALEGNAQRLQFPAENKQWDRLQAGFQAILSSVPALRRVVGGASFVHDAPPYFRPVREHIVQTVVDPAFVSMLEKAITLLEPFRDALSHFEQQDAPCSDVFAWFVKTLPDAFGKLGPILSEDERGHLLLLNQKRLNAMYGDGHGVAYLLDPRYVGDGLSVELRKIVEDIVYAFPTVSDDGRTGADADADADDSAREEAQLEMAQQLTEFVIDAGRERTNRTFRYSMLARHKKSVLQYWLTDGQRWPRLQQLACRVFCLPASTLRLERVAASLLGVKSSSGPTDGDEASATGETHVEDKIQFIRVNTLLLGDDGPSGVTC